MGVSAESCFASVEVIQSPATSVVLPMSSALKVPRVSSSRGEASLVPLLCQIAERDEVAFARLYEVTSHRVFGVALRILHDREAAADAALETYWTVWRDAGNFDPQRGRPLTWILTVARSRAIDRLRKQRRWSASEKQELELARDEDPVPNPEIMTAEAGSWARLRAALAGLPELQRVAIETAFFSGLSHAEVAAELGEPLGTVKSRIRLGLRSLRGQLAEIG